MVKRRTGLINKKFAFQHILPNNVKVKQLDTTKSASGNIPTKIIKDSVDVCVNHCLHASMKFGGICHASF